MIGKIVSSHVILEESSDCVLERGIGSKMYHSSINVQHPLSFQYCSNEEEDEVALVVSSVKSDNISTKKDDGINMAPDIVSASVIDTSQSAMEDSDQVVDKNILVLSDEEVFLREIYSNH